MPIFLDGGGGAYYKHQNSQMFNYFSAYIEKSWPDAPFFGLGVGGQFSLIEGNRGANHPTSGEGGILSTKNSRVFNFFST